MDPGFQRRRRKEKLYDKLHRGVVKTCIGVTVVSSLFLGLKIYQYFRYVRPLQKIQAKLAEDDLLLEGRNVENSPNAELSI